MWRRSPPVARAAKVATVVPARTATVVAVAATVAMASAAPAATVAVDAKSPPRIKTKLSHPQGWLNLYYRADTILYYCSRRYRIKSSEMFSISFLS